MDEVQHNKIAISETPSLIQNPLERQPARQRTHSLLCQRA